jgi:hypothetical protein
MFFLACSSPEAPPQLPAAIGAPDIVVYAIAGIRADAELLEQSKAAYKNAYATSAAPFASFGSLLTGRYPAAIPLCCPRGGASMAAGARPWCTELPTEIPALPDILQAYGYQTALLTTGGTGFDTFNRRFQTVIELNGAPDQAGVWWESHANSPRLIVVYIGTLAAKVDSERSTLPELLALPERFKIAQEGPPSTDPAYLAAKAALQKQYEEELGHLKDLVAALERLWEPEWTVLAGLNGVNLGETTGFGQRQLAVDAQPYLLERSLHVPLQLQGPLSGNIEELVELTDILPTLLARAGAMAPAGSSGRDFLSGQPDPSPWAYADFGDMLSIREGDFRLTLRTYVHDSSSLDPAVTDVARDFSPSTRWTFHQVLQDPEEASNLLASPEFQEEALKAHTTLLQVRLHQGAPPPESMTPTRLWELRMSAGQGYW